MRGEIDAAEAHALPRLIERADLRGDLHMHTTETDGKDDIRTMAVAAREAGLEYIAITDHSQSLAMANGLDERRAIAHAARIRALDAEGPASACWPASNATSGRTARSIWPTTASPRSTSSSPRCTRRSTRIVSR